LSSTQVNLRAVGVVETNASDDRVREGRREAESTISVFPEFQDALTGLEGFSHIFVLSYLHKLRPDQIGALRVKPRRLLKKGFTLEELPLVGVFAIDSPTRPNPVGLSLVELIKIKGTRLLVRGLDCFNGTPVLDIKPYRGDYRAERYELPEWYRKIRERVGEDV
jgi:tRNA-Thr(GGU) m(6)t(6)A37 methyltransferase TsaA